jgi:hypothetical protein
MEASNYLFQLKKTNGREQTTEERIQAVAAG